MRIMRVFFLILGLMLVAVIVPNQVFSHADAEIPPVWDIVADNFESGSLESWDKVSAGDLSLAPNIGHNDTYALSVFVGQHESYIYKTAVARAEEGYLTFWFNPNGVLIPDPFTWWPPGNSINIASVIGESWWPPLVSLYIRNPGGQGYKGYLTWPTENGRHYDYEAGEFSLADGWQKITLGYRVDEWVAVWVDNQLIRYEDSDISHEDPYGEIIEFGKTNANDDITPVGVMLFDEVAFQVPRINDLWVDEGSGNDENDGLTSASALRTIQRASDLAGPGTTVHIQPGVYRETVWPAMDGSLTEPVLYIAENGPNTASLRGSEGDSSLTWTQLAGNTIGLPPGVDPTNIYYTDLSTWALEIPPRFIVELDDMGEVITRYPLAREPDWQVITEWKHHEFWWAADGGSDVSGCDPFTDSDSNCDLPWRSLNQLTDRTNDVEPVGVEPGNLSSLGDLTGGTIVAIDTKQGHYVYRRSIVEHDVPSGRVTVDEICEHDGGSGDPGLGWGSKYYIEGKPYLLDMPGEWWYDANSGLLYLWPRTSGNPATMEIEISRRENGFSLRDRSYTSLDGLNIEFLNGSAIYQANWSTHKSYNNTLRNLTLRYANWGVYIEQSVRASEPASNVIDGFLLEDSEIANMDTHAVRLIDWWEDGAAADSFSHSGILNTVIRNNEMHNLGFRTDGDNAIGASFGFANKLRIEGNHVHHVAHNGFQISRSVIQSTKDYGFSPDEIKTGEILIKDNVFEKACQLTTDCGGLKIWGSPPDNHVFRDLLVTGNVFRDTFGWTYVSEKRGRWMGGSGSHVRGMGGFGLYIDHASGLHAYRNVSYNNAYTGFMVYGVWRDGDIVYVNNVAANSLYGMIMGGGQYDTHGFVNTQVVNNIITNNENYGISHSDGDGEYDNLDLDHNLYFANGWRLFEDGGMWKPGVMILNDGSSYLYYQTLAEVQTNTSWEIHGVEGTPSFWDFDPADHNLHDGSWPDFHLTNASDNAIDQGVADLPPSLSVLLDAFDIDDYHWGTAYDIGRYEAGFSLTAEPWSQSIEPGGVARYVISLNPSDLLHPVTLTVGAPPPDLTLDLNPNVITSELVATLNVTDHHTGTTLLPGQWHQLSISGIGMGFSHSTSVELLIGGARIYLPVILKD